MTNFDIPTNLKPVTPAQVALAKEYGTDLAVHLNLSARSPESVTTPSEEPGMVTLFFRRGIVIHLWMDTMANGRPFVLCFRYRQWKWDENRREWVKARERLYDPSDTYAMLAEVGKPWEAILAS